MLVGTFDRLTQDFSIVMGEQHLSEHSFNYRNMKIDPHGAAWMAGSSPSLLQADVQGDSCSRFQLQIGTLTALFFSFFVPFPFSPFFDILQSLVV